MQAPFKNPNLSDCDSDQPMSENINKAQSSITLPSITLSSRPGVLWKQISDMVNRGRAAAENIFSQRSAPTSYPQRGDKSKSPLTTFRLFIDKPILSSIQKYTIKHGPADDKNFSVKLCKVEKFIGLQTAHSVLTKKNIPFHQLCNKKWGIQSLAK